MHADRSPSTILTDGSHSVVGTDLGTLTLLARRSVLVMFTDDRLRFFLCVGLTLGMLDHTLPTLMNLTQVLANRSSLALSTKMALFVMLA